jgi:hypothetical protein
MDLQTFIIHCFLAAIILTICCLWAIDMKKGTSENAKNIMAIEELSSNFSKNLEFANMLAHGVYDQATEIDRNDPFVAVLLKLQSKLKRLEVGNARKLDSFQYMSNHWAKTGRTLKPVQFSNFTRSCHSLNGNSQHGEPSSATDVLAIFVDLNPVL